MINNQCIDIDKALKYLTRRLSYNTPKVTPKTLGISITVVNISLLSEYIGLLDLSRFLNWEFGIRLTTLLGAILDGENIFVIENCKKARIKCNIHPYLWLSAPSG